MYSTRPLADVKKESGILKFPPRDATEWRVINSTSKSGPGVAVEDLDDCAMLMNNRPSPFYYFTEGVDF